MDKLITVINRNSVGVNHPFSHAKKMIDEIYGSNENYSNYLVIIGYNIPENDITYYRKEYPNKKIAILQLEQLYDEKSLWFNRATKNINVKKRTETILKWLNECDEIWEYDIDNKWFLEKIGFKKVKLINFGYCESLKKIPTKNTNYDIIFYGSINERRAKILNYLAQHFNLLVIGEFSLMTQQQISQCKFKLLNPVFNDKLDDYISQSKIVLNLNYYDSKIQEQVRIFYPLINGKCVISEKTKRNYFGDLIYEFENLENLKELVKKLIKTDEWRIDNSGKFKNKNFRKFKVGAVYNTFYGLEFLEKSIESIKNVVDYVVIVHQRKSFSGEIEPSNNDEIINKLKTNGYINKVLNYEKYDVDKLDGMIEKRNYGLNVLKELNFDFVLPLDTDEHYNERELISDINKMVSDNLDTCYHGIVAYYYNENNFFIDTYFVPSVYRINDRIFKRGLRTSLLCDPARKMEEKKVLKSKHYMHHLTYMKSSFENKLNSKISLIDKKNTDKFKLSEHLQNWSEGKKGLVYTNDKNGDLILTDVLINKIKIKTNDFSNGAIYLNDPKIVILSTLWNASKQIPQYISSIKLQTFKNFRVIIVDDNSTDGSLLLLQKLTSGDDRFTIIRNNVQKFKTQNFYEIIHNQNLINNDDIIIELDGDDAFYGNNVVEKVFNHFRDPNLWIAGYKWIDNRGQKSPFKFSPNADNPRSHVWSYSAMRVFKAFLFRNIKQSDLMFEGNFVRAANDVAYGMPMLEMSGKEHFKSFNDITYLYNWHDKNTHTKTSSVKDTGLQKRTEKYIYTLPRYQKLKINETVTFKQNNIVIPKVTNVANTEKISKIKNLIPGTQKPQVINEVVTEPKEIQKVINKTPKIANNSNIRKITAQILTGTKKDTNPNPEVIIKDKPKIEVPSNNQTKNTPRFNFDIPIVKPQNKVEIDKKRQEFENVLLYTAKGKKEVKPTPPKNIGIRI
jgi:glycosyltransferase involved in cell wall biosynthesis